MPGLIYSLNRFRAALSRRWCGALSAGIREHPAAAKFYQLPHQGVDLPAAIDGLDLAHFESRQVDLRPLFSTEADG
ncbi:MAG: hypothetical protein HY717_14755 [Planctomycetes bacterium]|nr:hypothetical protein [Planctomycetota bacterium]